MWGLAKYISQDHCPGTAFSHGTQNSKPRRDELSTHLHEFMAFQKIILQHLLGKAPHGAIEFICCFTTFYLPRWRKDRTKNCFWTPMLSIGYVLQYNRICCLLHYINKVSNQQKSKSWDTLTVQPAVCRKKIKTTKGNLELLITQWVPIFPPLLPSLTAPPVASLLLPCDKFTHQHASYWSEIITMKLVMKNKYPQ